MLRILVVCTGNICRSPIAHGLLVDRLSRQGGSEIEVRSVGTWGRTGSPATREAVAAAAEHGIDIRKHRSAGFTPEPAAWADLIITMTSEQAEEVLEQVPDAAAKTFTLKELVAILRSLPAPEGQPTREALMRRIVQGHGVRSGDYSAPVDLDVADPLGLSDAVYRAVAAELQGLVEELLRGLVGGRDTALLRHE